MIYSQTSYKKDPALKKKKKKHLCSLEKGHRELTGREGLRGGGRVFRNEHLVESHDEWVCTGWGESQRAAPSLALGRPKVAGASCFPSTLHVSTREALRSASVLAQLTGNKRLE